MAGNERLARLERGCKLGVVKVSIKEYMGPGKFCTGFVVGLNPCVVMTCSHFVKHQNIRDIPEATLHFANGGSATATAWVFEPKVELLLLMCFPVFNVPRLNFADISTPLGKFEDIWCCSHPVDRDWRVSAGIIMSDPFKAGNDVDMILFDHDLSLFVGSSGAAIFNRDGNIIGMQVGEMSDNFNAVCIPNYTGQKDTPLKDKEFKDMRVQRISVHKSNIKQAVHLWSLHSSIRQALCKSPEYDGKLNLNALIEKCARFYLQRKTSTGKGTHEEGSSSGSKRSCEESYPWQTYSTPDGHNYYFNILTGEKKWAQQRQQQS